ncbi:hypothetical protein FB107DRAFT_219082 [Schizophyllum commune]
MTERTISDVAVIDDHRDFGLEEVEPGRRSSRSQASAASVAHASGAQTVRALSAFRREARAEYEQVASMNSALRAENVSLRSNAQRLTIALQLAEAERDCADRELARARQLLQARTEELAVLQGVLGPVDRLSERDIVRKVEELNEEVFQLSALMSDGLEYAAGENTERISQANKAVHDRRGLVVYNALKVGDDALRQAAVQVALQATACSWSGSVVRRWSLDANEKAVSARWKSVTRRSIREAEGVKDEGLRAGFHAMMQTIVDASGYRVGSSSASTSAIDEGIEAVLRLSIALRDDICAVTSTELESWLPRPDEFYDDATMETDDEQPETAAVACGISLGLFRTAERSETHTLLKPKVVLVSAFDAPCAK